MPPPPPPPTEPAAEGAATEGATTEGAATEGAATEGAVTRIPPPPAAVASEPVPEADGGETDVLVAPLPIDARDETAMRAYVRERLATRTRDASTRDAVAPKEEEEEEEDILSVRFSEDGGAAVLASRLRVARARRPPMRLERGGPGDPGAEVLCKTLWPDELVAFDPSSARLRVAGVPAAIDESAMRQVFSTYGGVRSVAMDAEPGFDSSERRRASAR